MNQQERKTQKQKTPFRWLLMIPIQLVLALLFVKLGVMMDTSFWAKRSAELAEQGIMGHGVPLFSLFAIMIAVGMTIIIVIISIVATVVSLWRRNKKKKDKTQNT